LASGGGHYTIVRSLLSRNDVGIYARDTFGPSQTALYGYEFEAVVDLLLSRLGGGVDINAQDA